MCFPSAIGFHASMMEAARQEAVARAQRSMEQNYLEQWHITASDCWNANSMRTLKPDKRDGEKCPHCGASETRTRASGVVICAYCRSGG